MTKIQIERQINMLLKDLSSADKRCKRISKECGLEDNHLIEYAMEQTKLVLQYIEQLKREEK